MWFTGSLNIFNVKPKPTLQWCLSYSFPFHGCVFCFEKKNKKKSIYIIYVQFFKSCHIYWIAKIKINLLHSFIEDVCRLLEAYLTGVVTNRKSNETIKNPKKYKAKITIHDLRRDTWRKPFELNSINPSNNQQTLKSSSPTIFVAPEFSSFYYTTFLFIN